MNFRFRRNNFDSLLGGQSPLDFVRLSIDSVDEAEDFLRSYGFDWQDPEDQKQILEYYQRALVFVKERILEEGESLPDPIGDYNEFKDVRYLFFYANPKNHKSEELQKMSCALLKVMHLIVHFTHDIYSLFPQEISSQILKPLNRNVVEDPVAGATFLKNESDSVRLYKFEQKPIKDMHSGILKLLARPKVFALSIYDSIGVRYVANNELDAFRVMRFLVLNSVISAKHTIPNQSVNSVYPVNLFMEVMDQIRTSSKDMGGEAVMELMDKKLKDHADRAQYMVKDNVHTGAGYQFMKFISRRLVKIKKDGETHRFFYPFEVQVLTKESYLQSIQGELAHDKYKSRQTQAARRRLLGFKN